MAELLERLRAHRVGTAADPVNLRIMDVDAFIREERALPVSSTLTYEPSTTQLHPDGLYSEDIFAPIGTPERMTRCGFIELNTDIFHPKIFQLIVQLGSVYKDIMTGATYATFNPVTKDFERVVGDPMDVPGADTGYAFFMRHFRELSFRQNASSKRDDRIATIEKYKDIAIMSRFIVIPAGLRDIANDSSGRLIQDDINKLYISLILFGRSIPKGSQSVLYDQARYQIQSKAQELYEYIENILDGKRGFYQGSFARRRIAGGTRNVITASPSISSSPDDPQMLRCDDVQVGVYQTLGGLRPAAQYGWLQVFVYPIFKTESSVNIALPDPKTFKLSYVTVTPDERDKWTSIDGINKLINGFSNPDIRGNPILIKGEDGTMHPLALIYDEGDTIAMCRSIDDLIKRWPRPINRSKLRAITYIEAFYLVAELISVGKHALVTRYPVIEQGSTYVAKIHVVSTTPSRLVQAVNLLEPNSPTIPLRQYPTLGASYMDAAMVHPSKLSGLGGDHDGDKVSIDMIWTSDANAEMERYLNMPRSIMDTDMRFTSGSETYLVSLYLHNLTRR